MDVSIESSEETHDDLRHELAANDKVGDADTVALECDGEVKVPRTRGQGLAGDGEEAVLATADTSGASCEQVESKSSTKAAENNEQGSQNQTGVLERSRRCKHSGADDGVGEVADRRD